MSYVGETKRALLYRFDEHKKSVENNDIDKVIPKHCINSSHKMNWDKMSVLDYEDKFWKRRTSKMLHIHLQSPLISLINKKDDSRSLHNSYISILENFKRKYK